MGAPRKDVRAPMGRTTGAMTERPKVSARISSSAPATAEEGTR